MNNVVKSIALLFLLGIIWGSGYSIAKFAMSHGVPPLGYSFWQSLGPAIVLTLLSLSMSPTSLFRWRYLGFYLVCGLIGIAIPNSNMYFAAPHLPAGILAVIVNTVPIITYPLAMLAKQENFSWLRLLCVLIGVCGIFFIVVPHKSLPTLDITPWALITLLSPFSFAVCAVFISRFRPTELNAWHLSAGMMLASALFLTPLMLHTQSFYPINYPFSIPELAVILEIILSSIGYVIFFKLLKAAGPVYYSLVGGVVAITGLLWGHFLFDEHLNYWNFIAIALILIAIAMLSFTQQSHLRKNHVG